MSRKGAVKSFAVNGVTVDVYYDLEVEIDPLATGDSRTEYTVEISSIELPCDRTNLMSIISQEAIDILEDKIVREAKDG
jgi:hypothetical protein